MCDMLPCNFKGQYLYCSDEDEVAQLLISANADVNSKNNKGATPLIIAAVKGHHSVLRILASNSNIKLQDQVEYSLPSTFYVYEAIYVCIMNMLYL